MSVNVIGLEEVNRALETIARKMGEAAEEETFNIAADLAGEASRRAPVLTGDLRGDLAAVRKVGNTSYIVGSSLPYAIAQHEHLEYHHPRGGEPKYLERPFNEKVDSYIVGLAEALENAIK